MFHHIKSRTAITLKFDVMKKKESIKNSIKEALKNGNYSVAFNDLLKLEHFEVAEFLAKNKIFEQQEISVFFWNEYCINHLDFTFSSKSNETILNWYLQDLVQTNCRLSELLSTKYPDKFIAAIKRNKAFLNEEFLLNLQKYAWNEKQLYEIQAFGDLRKAYITMQYEIDTAWNNIENEDLFKILSVFIAWTDNQYFSNYNRQFHYELIRVYNYTLGFINSKKQFDEGITETDFDKLFMATIYIENNQKIELLFEQVLAWIRFESVIFNELCFQTTDNMDIERRQSDVLRIVVNEQRYLKQAIEKHNEQEGNQPLNQQTKSIDKSQKIAHLQQLMTKKTELLLNDLQLKDVTYNGENTSFLLLVEPLIKLSINKNLMYANPMRKIMSKGFNWLDSYNYLVQKALDNKSLIPLPYIYFKEEDLKGIFRENGISLIPIEEEGLKNNFTFQFSKNIIFNPFHQPNMVMETPFLKIGDFLLAPVCFIAKNRWFYSAAQKALALYSNKKSNRKALKETSSEMEKLLANEFEYKGFQVKVINDKQSGQIDGDIDIFVNDGKTQLLIQLKRTRFKLDLAADYKEKLEVDLKASWQINAGIESIQENTSLGFEIMENHKRWIVTTSNERLITEIDGCLKVNYFDLLWALRNETFESLEDLAKYIEGDRSFRDNIN